MLAAVLANVACQRRARDPQPPPPPPAPAVIAPAVVRDAGSPQPARAVVDASAPAAPVDLLRVTESTVTVSSAVDNANDRPDRLVDGDLATAWSSRTGEMERTWIEVRLPDDVRVSHLELTAGYTRQTERQDLFTGNVRIRRVRVSRAGQSLGEFDLDPEQRGLQRVNAAGAGGVWRIETLGLVPGTRATWREVTVSELRVMGTPGAARRSAAQAPTVLIAGAAPAAAGAANAALTEAITTLMHDVAGDGVSEEDQGCGGGGWADSCVRDRWAAVASALFDAARERCAVGAEAPTRASERLWSRYERKAARTHRGDEPDEDREYEATEALNAYVDSLAAMIDACPTAANLRRAQRAVREREIAPLRNFRP
jgi:hypothetical protein